MPEEKKYYTLQFNRFLEWKNTLKVEESARNRLTVKMFDEATAALVRAGVRPNYKSIGKFLSGCYYESFPRDQATVHIFLKKRDEEGEYMYVKDPVGGITISFLVPPEFLRLPDDKPQVGDWVYTWPDSEDDPMVLGVHPRMKQMAAESVPMKVAHIADKGYYALAGKYNDEDQEFHYSRNWISFTPLAEPKKEKAVKKKVPSVDSLLDKARERYRKYQNKFRLENWEQRCAFSLVCREEGDKLVPYDSFPDVCHAPLNKHYPLVGFVDFIEMHVRRADHYSVKDLYKGSGDFTDKFFEFFDYWVNRGPFARVFITKSPIEAMENGVAYDCNYPRSALAAAAVGLRSMGEFPETPLAFHEFRKVFDEHVACILAMLSSFDTDDEEWYYNFRGWHDILSPQLSVDILKEFGKSSFPMWENKPANESDDNYRIYTGIGYLGGKESLDSVLSPITADGCHSLEELVKLTKKKKQLKEFLL